MEILHRGFKEAMQSGTRTLVTLYFPSICQVSAILMDFGDIFRILMPWSRQLIKQSLPTKGKKQSGDFLISSLGRVWGEQVRPASSFFDRFFHETFTRNIFCIYFRVLHLCFVVLVYLLFISTIVALRMIEIFGQEQWQGCILFSPMCKIDQSIQPPKLVVQLLTYLNKIWPTLAIVPSRIPLEKCFADPAKLAVARKNPHSYCTIALFDLYCCGKKMTFDFV